MAAADPVMPSADNRPSTTWRGQDRVKARRVFSLAQAMNVLVKGLPSVRPAKALATQLVGHTSGAGTATSSGERYSQGRRPRAPTHAKQPMRPPLGNGKAQRPQTECWLPGRASRPPIPACWALTPESRSTCAKQNQGSVKGAY